MWKFISTFYLFLLCRLLAVSSFSTSLWKKQNNKESMCATNYGTMNRFGTINRLSVCSNHFPVGFRVGGCRILHIILWHSQVKLCSRRSWMCGKNGQCHEAWFWLGLSVSYWEVLKVMLHWSTCNANLQRRFATHVFCTNLQTCYTFESLSKTSNALQHCKYRKKSFATGRYTRMIFRATSYHCKLALQVDQCNTTFTLDSKGFLPLRPRPQPPTACNFGPSSPRVRKPLELKVRSGKTVSYSSRIRLHRYQTFGLWLASSSHLTNVSTCCILLFTCRWAHVVNISHFGCCDFPGGRIFFRNWMVMVDWCSTVVNHLQSFPESLEPASLTLKMTPTQTVKTPINHNSPDLKPILTPGRSQQPTHFCC